VAERLRSGCTFGSGAEDRFTDGSDTVHEVFCRDKGVVGGDSVSEPVRFYSGVGASFSIGAVSPLAARARAARKPDDCGLDTVRIMRISVGLTSFP